MKLLQVGVRGSKKLDNKSPGIAGLKGRADSKHCKITPDDSADGLRRSVLSMPVFFQTYTKVPESPHRHDLY